MNSQIDFERLFPHLLRGRSEEERGQILDGMNRKLLKNVIDQYKKADASHSLDEYITFLMAVQEITPFEHKPIITPAHKNLL